MSDRAPSVDDLSELRLDGEVALVTGAARGIGLAVSRLFLGRGAAVVLFDRDESELDRVVADLQQRRSGRDVVERVVGDVSVAAECDHAVAAALERFGRLDILVNNAGIGGTNAPLWEIDDDGWQRVLDVNLNGVFYCCRAAVPAMRAQGSGRIVNIASIAGKEGNPNASHYSVSKAGVIALTKSLGKELATDGVLVNAIAPAVVDTEILAQVSPEHVEYMRSRIPMGRFGRAEEVARLIGFLASSHLSFSTGAVYDLSGGRATY